MQELRLFHTPARDTLVSCFNVRLLRVSVSWASAGDGNQCSLKDSFYIGDVSAKKKKIQIISHL